MSWNFLIAFAIAVGAYLVVVFAIYFYKRWKKKHNKKDDSSNVENDKE